MHPIQASWTDRSLLNRWSVEVLKISKIGEIAMKNLNISMSSCANRNLFRWNSSPQSPPECIPYKRLEQTAPCLIAGQLKSWKSAKSAKLGWKTSTTSWILVRFRICFDGIQALNGYYNSSHTFVLVWPLLPKAFLSWISPAAPLALTLSADSNCNNDCIHESSTTMLLIIFRWYS